MFVVITHIRYAGAFSSTDAYIAPSLEDAKYLCEKILQKRYDTYCDEEGKEEEFELVPVSNRDCEILMMNYDFSFTYKGGYGEIVTITKA